jgi:hypothetical protein
VPLADCGLDEAHLLEASLDIHSLAVSELELGQAQQVAG